MTSRSLQVHGPRLLPALVLSTLLLPATASAGKVVLTPLLADETVNAKQRLGVFQLIASELDFSPEVEGVVELTTAPPTLDDACLANPRCLSAIATQNEADQVVTGRISGAGGSFVLDLLFFDGAQVRTRKQYTVASDPTALANAITPIVRELLTGAAAGDTKPKPTSSNFSADVDDLAVGGAAVAGLMDPPAPMPVAPPPRPVPVPAAAVPMPPPAPVAGSDAARRLAMASAATAMVAAAPAPAPAAATPQPTDADLASMINFGGSANDISAEEIDQMIKFGAPPGVGVAPAPAPVAMAPAPAPRPVPQPDASLAAEDAELAALESGGGGIADLDGEPAGKAKAPAPTRSTGTVPKPSPTGGGGDIGHIAQITARGGYSKYYSFDFITGGAEVGVAVAGGLHLVAGLEAYAVNRVLPPELQLQTGLYSEWNYIFPINTGAIYKFPIGIAQPYVGADAIFVQYYKDEVGADWAAGGRFRAGVDLLFIPNFGFNLNVAAGGWFGQNWALIETGVGSAGFLPQVSGGPVVAF